MRRIIRSRCHAFALALLCATGAQAADTEAHGSHQHYADEPRAAQPGPDGELAPRLQNLGDHHFAVTTGNAAAQRFIDQGLKLAYAFNHAEARRAFREAARLDPALAMAYWGQALVLGPNINAMMQANEEPQAYEFARKAKSLADGATPREKALIDALLARYSGDAAQRRSNDEAYARAMHDVWQRFPEDDDIAVLYVESMMDLRPWGYWMPDGTPHPGTAEIVALTEQVLARNPRHPGALHLHIHLLEPTTQAARAEASADTLLTLMPAAGHMVHMPSHIYQRVGRYADAIRSNELAIVADEDYITQCRAQGLYPMAYYPHNIHFLWFAAMFDGQQARALAAARKVASKIDDATLAEMPMLAGFRVVPYWTLVRFGQWEDMLREPAPPDSNAFLTGAWHYARGEAFVGTGNLPEAKRALAALEATLAAESLDQPLFSPNTARALLNVGVPTLGGLIAAAEGNHAAAIAALELAVRREDALVYTEPSEWAYPPRHVLARVLLQAGRAAEAETVLWQDLTQHPENGWALHALAQALREQGKDALALAVQQRFTAAWARADVELQDAKRATSLAAAAAQ